MSKILFALIAVILSSPANAVRDGIETLRTTDNFANIVRITVGTNTCSGTRITFDTVLTAAHCFGEDSGRSSFKVEYLNGEVTITEKLRVYDVTIKSRDLDQELAVFKIHPMFGDSSLYVPTLIYDYKSHDFLEGDKMIMAGYGMDNSENTTTLKYGVLKYHHSKSSVTTSRSLDKKAMEERNKKYLIEVTKEAELLALNEKPLPELELANCDDMNLGWRARKSCRRSNNYLIYQRDLELQAIESVKRERELEIQRYLNNPIYKTTLIHGHEMLVMRPLERGVDEIEANEVSNNLPCPGDSGGPLFKKLPNGELALVAIVSNIVANKRVYDQVGKMPGYRICAAATEANYIPVSLHQDFLRDNNIIF